MLYKKNSEKTLDLKLFENPTCEYRGTPFWSWNTTLEKNELLWQIEQLKKMGFGGFHIHSRSGMNTKYLGEEFMDLVKACNQKAKEENMLTWLYDEDRWPSGFAGGYVTKNPKHRCKYMLMTVTKKEDVVDKNTGIETGKSYLLSVYDIVLNDDGTLKSYKMIDENAAAVGTKWYAYACTNAVTGRFNNQSYVDSLSKEAIAEFIDVTYNAYKEAVGEDFGGSIPAMFTDEPQFSKKQCLSFATSKEDVTLPYTTDLPESYAAATGYDLLEILPELFWNLPDDKPSKARYLYHDHVCERFTEAFLDQCGKWCEENNIAFTGHLDREGGLDLQSGALGEAMRTYRAFQIPGIDMLCNKLEYTTAKQCQSAVHQYDREAMVSELYGVTGWDYDFRGHKFQGDWQAALGVTVRVPHLSWVTMKGSAKRDYPASISYQSAWYKEYPFIEDHYSRLNTALTRGKPDVKVAMIHPIESYWIHYGPSENTAPMRSQLEENFNKITNWLLFGTIDFDFLCESLLPSQYTPSDDKTLHVGAMNYSAVIVPALETIRKTTLDILVQYKKAGGKVIFIGDCPKYVDAEINDDIKALFDESTVVSISGVSILNALKEYRDIEILNSNGMPANFYFYNMRKDNDCKWLFIANGRKPFCAGKLGTDNDTPVRHASIYIKGEYTPIIYDTFTGKTQMAEFELKNGYTIVKKTLYSADSLLLKLEEKTVDKNTFAGNDEKALIKHIDFRRTVDFSLEEPNVLVLDLAKYSSDGINYSDEPEEILRIDKAIRKKLGFPMADGADTQPWTIPPEVISNYYYLKFEFNSELSIPCRLAYEEAIDVTFNGVNVPVVKDGYFTDKKIYVMPMPDMAVGKNELIVKVPIGKALSIENFFILGEFGVKLCGCEATVTELPKKIGFGSVTSQGLPFYGAGITYKMEFDAPADCDAVIKAARYKGCVIKAFLDGKDIGYIAFAPYRIHIPGLKEGKHVLELTLYASRVNCFNALHNAGNDEWIGPGFWYSGDNDWAYEYQLKDVGIMKSPDIDLYK